MGRAWVAPWGLVGVVACQASVVPLEDSGPLDAGFTQDAEGPDGGSAPDQGVEFDAGRPDSGPRLRTFTGVVGTEFVDDRSSRFEPTDLRTWTISARAEGRTHPGVGLADGTFSIEAPPGELEVELIRPPGQEYSETTLVVTRLDRVDLTGLAFDERSAAPPASRLTLSGTFVEPWGASDDLRLLVGGSVVRDLQLDPGLRVGDSAFGPWTVPWVGRPELRGRLQDDVIVGRWTTTSTTQGVEFGLTEMDRLPAVDVTDRAPREFAMSRPPTEARSLDYDLSLFDLAEVHPRAEGLYRNVSVTLVPGATTRGWVEPSTAVQFSSAVRLWALLGAPDSSRRLQRNLPASPPGFEICATAFASTFVDRSPPFGNGGGNLASASVFDCRPGWRFPLVLSLGAPRNLKIAGLPGQSPLPPVGLAPTITWDAPARGRANGYLVWVFGYDGNRAFRYRTAWTERTTLTLPAGWLAPGFVYDLGVVAIDREGGVLERPLRGGVRQQTHVAVSESFAP